MRTTTLINILALSLTVAALPTTDNLINLVRRQDINFTLADAVSDTSDIDDASGDASTIAEVVADVNANPLPQEKRDVNKRGMSGYSASISLDKVAINAPLNCNGADTYMGSKMWNDPDNIFLEDRCAAACSAQSAYNLKHPPSRGSPKLCQFYNTYVLSKNGVSQGQYWSVKTRPLYCSLLTHEALCIPRHGTSARPQTMASGEARITILSRKASLQPMRQILAMSAALRMCHI